MHNMSAHIVNPHAPVLNVGDRARPQFLTEMCVYFSPTDRPIRGTNFNIELRGMGAGCMQSTREMCVYLSRTGIAPPHIWCGQTSLARACWLATEHPDGATGKGRAAAGRGAGGGNGGGEKGRARAQEHLCNNYVTIM